MTAAEQQAQKRRNWFRIFESGATWLAIGLGIIFLALYIAAPTDKKDASALALELAKEAGVAVVVFGLFHVLLEMPDWHHYFEERIKQIVVQQEYLAGLDDPTLRTLETNVLKAQFKNPNIDREGSFLQYFHANLHGFISLPYRENVTRESMIMPADQHTFRVSDKTTYSCRRVGDAIQSQVAWSFDPKEMKCVESLSIRTKFPMSHKAAGKEQDLALPITLNEINQAMSELVIEVPLKPEHDVDGLIIIIEAIYLTYRDRLLYWGMAHPTRNFSFTMMLPQDFEVITAPFVLTPERCLETSRDGYYALKYDSWMLPRNGIAWRINNRSLSTSQSQSAGSRSIVTGKPVQPGPEIPPSSTKPAS